MITGVFHNVTKGLSPRLRGNGSQPVSPPMSRGSIPALAGERLWKQGNSVVRGVYPRACGGTLESCKAQMVC